jgi:hypothetical protein
VGNFKERGNLEDLGISGVKFKMGLQEVGWWHRLGVCKSNNEPSGCIKCRKFLD